MECFEKEQVLYELLSNHIENFTREYNITYCQVLGILDLIKADTLSQLEEESEQNG